MQLITGLGNPGAKYENTLHNAGFRSLDYLAQKHNALWNYSKKFQAETSEIKISGNKIYLLKPHTYMNLSGDSVRQFSDYFKIEAQEILVVYDDIDLPFGKIRIRERGSAGGHKGLSSILNRFQTTEIARIRIGIRPAEDSKIPDLKYFVLAKLDKNIQKIIDEVLKNIPEVIENTVINGITSSMNKYNSIEL